MPIEGLSPVLFTSSRLILGRFGCGGENELLDSITRLLLAAWIGRQSNFMSQDVFSHDLEFIWCPERSRTSSPSMTCENSAKLLHGAKVEMEIGTVLDCDTSPWQIRDAANGDDVYSNLFFEVESCFLIHVWITLFLQYLAPQ